MGSRGSQSPTAAPAVVTYQEFPNAVAADAWLDSRTLPLLTTLKPLEQSQLRDYTGGGYVELNRSLRNETLSPTLQDKANRISNIIDKNRIQENIVVVRGAQFGTTLRNQLQVGAEFADKGFMSSSADQTRGFSGNVIFKIRIPAGARAMAVGKFSLYPNEREVLIDKGSRLRITGREETASGKTRITADLLLD